MHAHPYVHRYPSDPEAETRIVRHAVQSFVAAEPHANPGTATVAVSRLGFRVVSPEMERREPLALDEMIGGLGIALSVGIGHGLELRSDPSIYALLSAPQKAWFNVGYEILRMRGMRVRRTVADTPSADGLEFAEVHRLLDGLERLDRDDRSTRNAEGLRVLDEGNARRRVGDRAGRLIADTAERWDLYEPVSDFPFRSPAECMSLALVQWLQARRAGDIVQRSRYALVGSEVRRARRPELEVQAFQSFVQAIDGARSDQGLPAIGGNRASLLWNSAVEDAYEDGPVASRPS